MNIILRFIVSCVEKLGIFLLRLASLVVACAFIVIEPFIRLTRRNRHRHRKGFSPAHSLLPQIERNLRKRQSQRSPYGRILVSLMTLAIILIWILFY